MTAFLTREKEPSHKASHINQFIAGERVVDAIISEFLVYLLIDAMSARLRG